jgi:hypothetical protein
LITAGSFVVGHTYKITTVGTTDFTLIGAADSVVGTIFTATGVGTGTGTATQEYETLKLVSDIFSNVGIVTTSSKGAKVVGLIRNTSSNSKIRFFYNASVMELKVYQWVMNKLDKDTLFDLKHTFQSGDYEYVSLISGGSRERLDNGVVILEFDWIEADV